MKIFDNQLRNALNKLIGKDLRNNLIKQHEEDLNIAATSMNGGEKPAFPLITTSKELYKRTSKQYIERIFNREKTRYDSDYDHDINVVLKSLIIGTSVLIAILAFLSLILLDTPMATRIFTVIRDAMILSLIPGGMYAAHLILVQKKYLKNIKKLKTQGYVQDAISNLKEAKKAIMVTNDAVCFIDLTSVNEYNTKKVPFKNIVSVYVTGENKYLEQISHQTEDGYEIKTLPPKKVVDGELQKLSITTNDHRTYSFIAPVGSNGEDAYKIAEHILNKKALCQNKMLANNVDSILKVSHIDNQKVAAPIERFRKAV